jgi:CRP-like cAMP-binding protein
VRIFKGSGDKEVTLAILSPGDFFGEMALMGDYEHSADAAAVGEVSLSVINRETFRSYVSEPIVLDVMGKMADRIRGLDEDVVKSQVADMNRRVLVEGRIEQRHWFT